ncbi:hypothetical protein FPOAC2_00419 [Fusarium poae]|jgi:hypothetical protein|uniref:Uncharacterized protein n=1 Tax=Fusarium poae TaxID=36050 RepID=A0A1B8B121_FUSPO|nr:hypothetical protein FPOAC1_000370 [Fusarium poae]KAG8674403.1 hypothetical protein FPOAC1_000370 [Fusarium poae]OBS26415.1 hypothetical protein FPOA_00356 [Fusarium poae]
MDIASLIEYSTWTLQRPLAQGSDQCHNTNNEPNEANNTSASIVQTLKYTLPTWYRHSLAVHVVDFNINHNHERDRGNIQSGIFIRTHKSRMNGRLFMPIQNPESGQYTLVNQEQDNLDHHPDLGSECAIGLIYKKDYETSFNQLLHLVPLPQDGNRNDPVPYGYRNGDNQDLPPKDSAG